MSNIGRITERHQAVVGAREYDAFGQILSQTGDWSDSDFGFHPNWLQLKGVAGGRYYLTPGGRAYDTKTGRFVSRDPIHVHEENRYAALNCNPLNVADPAGNQVFPVQPAGAPPHLGPRTFDATSTGLTSGFYLGGYMSRDDRVINTAFGTITVQSANLEGSKDRTFAAAKCVLKALGHTLPRTQNGVYWAQFSTADPRHPGHTVMWTGMMKDSLNFSFIDQSLKGSEARPDGNVHDFENFVLTLYHEVKGHNVDEATDPTEAAREKFDAKYEDPITRAIVEARKKPGKDDCCAKEPNKGIKIKSLLHQIYCDCGVKYAK